MKKLDKTALIGILICVGLLIFSVRENADSNRKALEAKRQLVAAEKIEAERSEREKAAALKAPEVASKTTEVAPAAQATEHQISTPELTLTFTSKGGGIKTAQLLYHNRTLHSADFITINESRDHPIGALSSRPESIDDSIWQVKAQDAKSITFATDTPDQIYIEKTFRIPEGNLPYQVEMEMSLRNNAPTPLEVDQSSASFIYVGGAAPQHYQEYSMQIGLFYRQHRSYFYAKTVDHFKGTRFLGIGSNDRPYAIFPQEDKDLPNLSFAGINNQFFATLIQAHQPTDGKIWADRYPVVLEGNAEKSREHKMFGCELAFGLPAGMTLEPGTRKSLSYDLYLGPKELEILRHADADHRAAYNEEWSLIMNYDQIPIFGKIFGWAIKPLAKLLAWSLVHIERLCGNWGVAIILLTILVRLAMWPVYARANRVSKRAAALAPMIEELKKKHVDDPQKLNQETFKLYNEYDANPMKGCLPSLLQLPVFLGFYRMLWGSVELRHQSFAGFVEDLTMPDHIADIPFLGIPLNILPIIMSLASFVQMMMMPKTMDKTQRMIFMLMPWMFLVFCYSFASGLALYWTVSNIFTVGQTWIMNKLPEPELKKKNRDPNKKSLMERLNERVEKAQASQQQQPNENKSNGSRSSSQVNRKKTSSSEALPQPGQSRTKLASEKGSRHTKSRKKKKR